MENKLVCNCKKVYESDIEKELATNGNIHDVEKEFEEVQKITSCSTGCGGCHDKIMDIIADFMNA